MGLESGKAGKNKSNYIIIIILILSNNQSCGPSLHASDFTKPIHWTRQNFKSAVACFVTEYPVEGKISRYRIIRVGKVRLIQGPPRSRSPAGCIVAPCYVYINNGGC